MIILGVSNNQYRADEEYKRGPIHHDNAATLFVDGQLVAAIEEERLDRIKHSNTFPMRAIKNCLEIGRAAFSDVDVVAVSVAEDVADAGATYRFLVEDPARRFRDGRGEISDLFDRAFGVDIKSRLRFCHHHLAHAWSAFAMAGHDRSLVLVFDGEGDYVSGSIWLGEGKSLTRLQVHDHSKSLGGFYVNLIRLLGYGMFDEYKVMGLAPYGNPERYREIFEKCFKLGSNGDYVLAPLDEQLRIFEESGLVEKARRSGEPFTQEHIDIAAALQASLETIVLHVVMHYQSETGATHLSMAGGVAQNCTVNGRILSELSFDHVFVQPASHDAGTALGAALSIAVGEEPKWRPARMNHVFWGTDIGDDVRIQDRLRDWEAIVSFEKLENAEAETAGLLSDGEVVGWVQGRSEYGPRALGNRSIVADPRPSENKLRINQMIKKREQYRPFAPAVLEERVHEFFIVPKGKGHLPFMTFVVPVREEYRSLLGAVTHVDGTARIQTVSRDTNRRFWELINEFDRLTGIPILLNTSFNNNAEPIVDSIDDAITCFLTTGLDRLVIGNYIIDRNPPHSRETGYASLAIQLPPQRKLVRRLALDRETLEWRTAHELESTRNREFGRMTVKVSPAMFSLLANADGSRSIGELLASESSIPSAAHEGVIREITELWRERVVHLYPRRPRG